MRQTLMIGSLVLAATAAAVPASAQTFLPRQQRPDWAIFGSGVSKTEQRLVLTATFGGGYEDDLTPSTPPPADGTIPAASPFYSGPFGSAGASLRYSVNKKSVFGDTGLSAYGRNYQDMTSDPFIGVYSADGSLNFALGKNSNLSTSYFAGQYLQNLSPFGYDPSGGWGNPGAPGVPTNPGAFTTGHTYHGYGASANYTQQLVAKLSAYGGYSFYGNDSWQSTPNGRYDSQYLTAGMRYALSKDLSLRAGYGVTLGGFSSSGNPTDFRSRTIDAGVDYNKALSLTRKSTLTFSSGVSGLLDPANQTHYYFVGGANFTHEVGRTWSFYAGVNRSANFYQTLGQPTISDWVAVGLNGTVGRHIEVRSGVSAWRGSAIGTNVKVYDSANAFAGARVGLNRVLAVAATYSYYRYGFTKDVIVLAPGFVRQTQRQTIQVSLVVWAPLVTRLPPQARSANASR